MSLNHFATYFRFLTNEYTRLVAEASLHRLQGHHGIVASPLVWEYTTFWLTLYFANLLPFYSPIPVHIFSGWVLINFMCFRKVKLAKNIWDPWYRLVRIFSFSCIFTLFSTFLQWLASVVSADSQSCARRSSPSIYRSATTCWTSSCLSTPVPGRTAFTANVYINFYLTSTVGFASGMLWFPEVLFVLWKPFNNAILFTYVS